jgi:tetratricopeptide (TPR) repeat protein
MPVRLRWLLPAALALTLLGDPAASQEPASGEITLEQILADPDNIELSFRYAEQRAAAGDLLAAAAALERILILRPDAVGPRLFYAFTLYRLGDFAQAAEQLTIVQRADLSPADRELVETYLARAQRRTGPLLGVARLSVGARFDSNVNGAPDSARGVAFGADADLVTDKQPDVGLLAAGDLLLRYDPGWPSGSTLFGRFYLFGDQKIEEQSLSFAGLGAALGSTLIVPDYEIEPSLVVSQSFADYDDYLLSYGGDLQVRRFMSRRWDLRGAAFALYEDYHNVEADSDAERRDGARLGLGVGATVRLQPRHELLLDIVYEYKDADAGYYAYSRVEGDVRYDFLLGGGQYLRLAGQVRFDQYDDPDPLIDPGTTRDDLWLRARVVYGVTLDDLAGLVGVRLPTAARDLGASIALEYLKRFSNINNYEFSNFGAELLISQVFEF